METCDCPSGQRSKPHPGPLRFSHAAFPVPSSGVRVLDLIHVAGPKAVTLQQCEAVRSVGSARPLARWAGGERMRGCVGALLTDAVGGDMSV